MAFWMPLLFAVLAILHSIWALNDYRKHRDWRYPAVKARMRIAGVMMLASVFLFFYL
jgi:hypothetical protein